MKKFLLAIITTILIASCQPSSSMAAPRTGGIFQRGETEKTEQVERDRFPGLPGHGETGDQPAPVGSGILALSILGGAYLVGKKSKELRK